MKFSEQFYKIKVKNSKKFYYIILFIIVLFMASYMHNNNISYIVMFFLFSISFVSLIKGRMNLKNISLKLIYYEPPFANRKFKTKIEVKGKGYDIHIEDKITIPYLKGKEIVELQFFSPKRGYFKIEKIEVYSYYPLGIAKFYREFYFNKQIIIHPEPKGKSLENYFFQSLSGSKDDFDGLKRYEKGDSLASIHWPSFAKGEELSKKFINLNESKELLFDYNKIEGDKESRLSQITLWILEAEKKGYKYKVILDREIEGNRDEILKQLALF